MPRSTDRLRRRPGRRTIPLFEALCLECGFHLLSIDQAPANCPSCGEPQLDDLVPVPRDYGQWSLAPERDPFRPTRSQRF